MVEGYGIGREWEMTEGGCAMHSDRNVVLANGALRLAEMHRYMEIRDQRLLPHALPVSVAETSQNHSIRRCQHSASGSQAEEFNQPL